MGEENTNTNIGEIHDSVKEYINLKADQYKLKGVENLSILSNKALVIIVSTMLGVVALQLLGFAVAFFLGELVGNTALGFAIISLLFAVVLAIVYAKRESLFLNRMVRMYMNMFFNGKGQ